MPAVAIPFRIIDGPGTAMVQAPFIAGIEATPVAWRPNQSAQQVPASSAPSLADVLRALWLLGAAAILSVLAGSLWSLYRLRQSGMPWIDGQRMADTMATDAGVNRRVTVMVHERCAVPAMMGVLRPTILLPLDARHWTEPDLRRVLIHELEHVRRGDWWILLSARAVCMAYWFHPLVWIAGRQLAVEAERACDDAVVSGTNRADYAEQLVALAARLSAPAPRLMLSMAKRSDLSTRVNAILNPGQQRGRVGTAAAATIIGIVGLLLGTVASVQAVAHYSRPASESVLSAGPVAGATIGARDVDQPRLQQASLNTTEVAGLSTRQQPVSTTAPLSRPEGVKPVALSALQQSPSPAVAAVTPSYVIGSGDVLTVTVWRQDDLGRDVLVRPDGKISFPLVNDIQAAGLTPEQLRQGLVETLRIFLQDPRVTVQVKSINGHRVFIVGAVARPGAYQLSDAMTVVQLIAVAGGLTDFARKDAIAIVRRVDGKSVSLSFDYAAFVSGQQLEQNILLLPGDTVVVR